MNVNETGRVMRVNVIATRRPTPGRDRDLLAIHKHRELSVDVEATQVVGWIPGVGAIRTFPFSVRVVAVQHPAIFQRFKPPESV